MKAFIAAAALAALVASPALAQSYGRDFGSPAFGSIYQWPVYDANGRMVDGKRTARRARSSNAYARTPEAGIYHWPAYDANGALINGE